MVGVVLIVAVALVVLEGGSITTKTTGPYTSVTVSGTAATTPGNTGVNLLFADESSKIYNATLTGNQYSIVLPSGHTYTVRLRFLGNQQIIPGSVGQCSAGNLTIPSQPSSASLTKNWSC